MKKRIFLFMLFALLVFLFFFIPFTKAEENVFLLYLTIYKNDSATLITFELLEGEVNIFPEVEGNYEIKIVSQEKKELFSGKFEISFVTFKEWIDEKTGEMRGEMIELNETEKLFRLPFFFNSEKIDLYHEKKLIFSLNIPESLCIKDGKCLDYCKDKNDPDCVVIVPSTTTTITTTTTTTITTTITTTPKTKCGNGICDFREGENFGNCREDCPSGSIDNYCDSEKDGICDVDCPLEKDFDCKITTTAADNSLFYLLGFFLIVIIIAGFIVFIKKF